MPNTTSCEGGGASVTHPEEISTCVAVLLSLTLKMSEDQLCLNISVSSSPSLRRKPLTTQQRWARKKQNAGKRKMNSSSQPEERRVKQSRVEEEEGEEQQEQPPPPAERADRKAPQKKKDGGGAVRQPPPPAERADRRAPQKKKDGGVKTSSLFKHNPDIPALLSPVVSQVKEKIFTSDSFSDMDLHPHLVATLNKVLNVSTVTSVQKQTMPVLLSGHDAVVRSQTGSGKTLAYAVPVVQSLQALQQKVSRSDGPLAVIIVPTRELAQQTFQTFQKLLKPFTWIVPGVLMGGEKRKSEKARLRKGINILVSTPGRLVDHIKNTLVIAFSSVRWLILDEADRILDLGFEKDLTVILNSLNTTGPSRQNVLLSATLSQGVTRLADVCLNDPVTINVSGPASSDLTVPAKDPSSSDQSESFTLPEALQQFVVVVPSKVRLVCLAAFILHKCKFSKNNKLIVFTSSCEAVEFLHAIFTAVLSTNQKPPLSFLRLHGNMKQEDRTEVFKEFSVSQSGVLLCTDVAARGLHLPAVTWIIQFTPPTAAAEYVHRVGRTARIGGRGSSLLFLTPAETAFTTELANHNISLSEMKLEDILSSLMMDDTFKGRGRYHSQSSSKALEQETRERATVLQTEFENFVHSDAQSLQNAKKALQSFLRSYTTFPAPLKHIFHIKHLHLGHTAKSFGLRDAPQGLSAPGGAKSKKKGNQKNNQKRGGGAGKSSANREESLLRSEFSDGREGGKERKRRNKKKTGGEEEE